MPEEGGVTKITRTNYGNTSQLTTSLSWNDSFWENRMYVNASVRGTYLSYSGHVETIVIDVKNFNYDLFLMSGVQVSQKYNWNVMANYIFRSKSELAQENNSSYSSMGIDVKKIFPHNISLNFGVRSLFFTKMKREKTDANYRYNLASLQNNRTFYVSLSIPFGNTKAKGAQYRKTSSSETTRRLREN